MGTRGLSGFILDGKTIASYQQYDSYPSGVGKDVLAFARENASHLRFPALVELVRTVRLVPEDGKPTADDLAALAAVGVTPQNVSTGSDWYAALRDNQGDLPAMLRCGVMTDSAAFLQDTVFCEWAYLIDLDEQKLRVYSGETEPVMVYDLTDLPSEARFLADLGDS